ncbi:phosphotransferase family protein [Sphingomonas sp. ID0503]|uniref:phosphotransferase family protein n=1 Tax=Sphingomonas sp. ID0503 TaxID=3399691 RepID=UPI003AFB6CF5
MTAWPTPAPRDGRTSATMTDMEPVLAGLIARRAHIRTLGSYSARNTDDVAVALTRFFAREQPGATVSDTRRMGGGASKEQFVFTLTTGDGEATRHVLRMDPLGSITETDRLREYEVLHAVQGIVPAPLPVWIDPDGSDFGQPAVIMTFVPGTTKPSDAALRVSGLGTRLGPRLRDLLKQQFLDNLVALHALDWKTAQLPSYAVPDADPKQAARWSLNFWRALWQVDLVEERPIAALAERWLEDNLPDARELVLTHGDYRTGNYLFDEESGRIIAVLDWELARIGDYHEDLAWVLHTLFGHTEDGVFRASDLYERDAFIAAYSAATGRVVDPVTLHFYAVFCTYKTYVIVAANGLACARAQQNHQDVLLTFLAAAGPALADSLCDHVEEGART